MLAYSAFSLTFTKFTLFCMRHIKELRLLKHTRFEESMNMILILGYLYRSTPNLIITFFSATVQASDDGIYFNLIIDIYVLTSELLTRLFVATHQRLILRQCCSLLIYVLALATYMRN